jgi:hypothetical protein
MTQGEINHLADQVNDIKDPDLVMMVIECIQKHEPQLATSEEELEIEASTLRQSTLCALQGLRVQIR